MRSMEKCAPILFLVFNRPDHTRKSLERIREAKPSRLYVHCDGPRPNNARDINRTRAVQAITQQIDWECSTKYLFRERNMGLRFGVFDAISWFFSQEEKGIILEDDCVPDLSFFRFATDLLDYYADNERVMHIGSLNTIPNLTAGLSESYAFTQLPFVWGWAGWGRAWKKMSIDFEGLDEFEQTHLLDDYISDPMVKVYLMDKFRMTRKGRIKSWAYAWHYSILKNKGLCIIPKYNLVRNIGIAAEDATNTTKTSKLANIKPRRLSFPLVHPALPAHDPVLEKEVFYSSQKSRFRLFLWYVMRLFGIR